ncbi:hypothetical protein OC846_001746 [Tilletia horrida]|uniref:Uncharacterized protein n=1 Tax=Tilletia horrida TaxID=155126 RepID=A0AAN6GYA4_9BASI|nr:hypothetical protein OC845_002832 [Tilletia horrida]KAK0555318.1 hypothetical protein OC846_001746 [Tilletia horrida]KAK0563961.1 hypothetical protein OC861_004543 [Tilletia horrida]
MTHSSLLLRQSQAALSLGSSSGLRASATRLLSEQDLSSYGFASSSTAQSSSSSATPHGAAASASQVMKSKRTIPSTFFRSVSPFIRLKRSKLSEYVPTNLEPFSLQSQLDLRKQLEECLQAPHREDLNREEVWHAYVALSHAPTVEKPRTSVAVVNLLPYLDISTHRAVLHRIVSENAAAAAFSKANERIKAALQENLPVIGYRAAPYRPPRRQHLRAVPVDPSSTEAVPRGPFILQQMNLASAVSRSAGQSDDDSVVTIDDYNAVLSMLGNNSYLVPLSKMWIELTQHQIEGVRPNIRSYAIVIRALYTYIQNNLRHARKQYGTYGRRKRDRVLELATFGGSASARSSRTELVAEDDPPSPMGSRQRRLKKDLENPSRVAFAINLAVTRLRTVLDTYSSDSLLDHEGAEGEAKEEDRIMQRELVDFSLRILRLAGDLQHFAILLRDHFGIRLGHPDVPIVEEGAGQKKHLCISVSTLNTILMALGEHASARDMVVAYESLSRALPTGPESHVTGAQQRANRLRTDEDDDGLLSIGSGEDNQAADGSATAETAQGNLFKIDWSALTFRPDSAPPAEQNQALDDGSATALQTPLRRTAYSVHPTTTSLRIMIRHLCKASDPISHSYASFTHTPLPRDDWAFQGYRYQPTGGQARKLKAEAIAEDQRRYNGDYSLLALAYLREGVDAYRYSINRMAIALRPASPIFFQPPPLVPTAACFRPLITVAARRRNMRTLRSAAEMVQESIALLERESELLRWAAKHWSPALQQARIQGQDDTRRLLLGDAVAAITRQSELCQQELHSLKVLLSGPSASSSAAPHAALADHELDETEDAEGPGGLEALFQRLDQRRRRRFIAKRANRRERAQAETLRGEEEAEQKRLLAVKRSERERIRRQVSGGPSSSEAGTEAASNASSDVKAHNFTLESR